MSQMLDMAQPVVSEHPFNLGLTGRWRVLPGCGAGRVLYDLAGFRHGRLQSTAAFTGARGRQGGLGSVNLNGTSGYISLPSFEVDGPFTLIAALYPTTVAVGTRSVFSVIDSSGSLIDINAEINRTAAKLSMYWGTGLQHTGTTSLMANQWSLVAYVRSGSAGNWTATTYLNEQLDASTGGRTSNPPTTATSLVTLGRLSYTGLFYFPGGMDDLWLYNGRGLELEDIVAAMEEIRRGSPETLRWLSTRYVSIPAAGQTITVGQVTEVASSQAMTLALQRLVAQNNETDLAQSTNVMLRRLIGQSSETDLPQDVALDVHRLILQATEANLSQSIGLAVRRLVAQSNEGDLAQALSVVLRRLVLHAEETDSSQATVPLRASLLGISIETDLAQAVLTGGHVLLMDQTIETDLAHTLTLVLRRLAAQVVETDLAQPSPVTKQRAVLQATETEMAQILALALRRLVGHVDSTEFAHALTLQLRRLVGQTVTTEMSLTVTVLLATAAEWTVLVTMQLMPWVQLEAVTVHPWIALDTWEIDPS